MELPRPHPSSGKNNFLKISCFSHTVVQLILEAPDEVHSFQINPEEQNIVVAGCANGQVALWDISEFQDKLKTTRKAGTDRQEDGSVFTEKDKHVGTPRLPYVLCSSIEASHRGVITDLKWLPKHSELGHNGDIVEMPENGHKQFYTCSLDGTVAFWDLRFKKDLASLDLTWRPFLRVCLNAFIKILKLIEDPVFFECHGQYF